MFVPTLKQLEDARRRLPPPMLQPQGRPICVIPVVSSEVPMDDIPVLTAARPFVPTIVFDLQIFAHGEDRVPRWVYQGMVQV